MTVGAGCVAPGPGLARPSAGDDCDDLDPARFPGAPDACLDGVDQDCDGHDDPCGARGGGSLADAGALLAAPSTSEVGAQLVGPGDLDGDGLPDVVFADSSADRVWIVSGPVAGLVALPAGAPTGVDLGYAPLAARDVSGDGRADLVLTGPDDVWALFGPVGPELDVGAAALQVHVTSRWPWARPVGDQDGDGVGDLFLTTTHPDRVRFVPGGPGSHVDTDLDVVWSAPGLDGWTLASGDADGDGVDDLLIGQPGAEGEARLSGAVALILGPAAQAGLAPAATLSGSDFADSAGWAVTLDGDLDGDGRADLVASAPWAGEVYATGLPAGDGDLLDADAVILDLDPDLAFEWSLAVPGDLDGDGFDDLLIGAMSTSSRLGAGEVRVAPGPLGGVIDAAGLERWVGVSNADSAGVAVAGVGDLDGDGSPDWATGASGAGAGGVVYVVYSEEVP